MPGKIQKNEYSFILEQTNVVSYDDIKILEESTVNKKPKIAFEATLQTANQRNNNNRIYDTAICESIVGKLTPKASNRSLLMEIDHPMFVSGDPAILKRRATIVEINNCAALIRKINFKNNNIIGEVETLSGFKGPDLANLINRDKVNIGFSLRALGSVETLADGTLMVKQPFHAVTYDAVSSPSHDSARVMQFLPECSTEFVPETATLYEADDVIYLEAEGINLDNGNAVMGFLNEIINTKFEDIISKGIQFKI